MDLFLARWGESDAVFGSLFSRAAEGIGCCFWIFFRELVAAVLIALVRMVASGKCEFNPGVADSDQLYDLGCTSFISAGVAAAFDAAEGAVVFFLMLLLSLFFWWVLCCGCGPL